LPRWATIKNLGIHTEMFTDGAIDLVERGRRSTTSASASTPARWSQRLPWGRAGSTTYIDDNPLVVMLDVAYVNDTAVIRRNPKVTAINSAIEVDLTGQVGADSMGTRQYSGVGGQMDFVRGAVTLGEWQPIIALPSVTKQRHLAHRAPSCGWAPASSPRAPTSTMW
jgi:4-hydroxybutyrate CoA-transferase